MHYCRHARPTFAFVSQNFWYLIFLQFWIFSRHQVNKVFGHFLPCIQSPIWYKISLTICEADQVHLALGVLIFVLYPCWSAFQISSLWNTCMWKNFETTKCPVVFFFTIWVIHWFLSYFDWFEIKTLQASKVLQKMGDLYTSKMVHMYGMLQLSVFFIFRVVATDDDTSPEFNTVTYWLQDHYNNTFRIDTYTGDVYLVSPLDYDAPASQRNFSLAVCIVFHIKLWMFQWAVPW